jgi:radical SAM superfamily enzyme YgiQ (UPF0313 family)
MSRVLLISANREHFPEPIFPLGAAYIAGALARSGAEVRVFDAGLARFPQHSLGREIAAFNPDTIGLSLRNIDNSAYPCTRHYVAGYRKLVETIRSSSRAPLFLGGPAFSIFPDELMDLLGGDGGVVADGEAAILRFCAGERGSILRADRPPLDAVGFPRQIDTIFPELHRYRTIGIQSARGCPHRCIYCTYPMLEGSRLRRRSVESVVDEIECLHRRHQRQDFFFVDSSFNADEQHLEKICKELIARRLRVRFSCYLTPQMKELALFGLLAEAGCVAVDFGTDAGSEAMLVSLGKSFTVADLRASSEACEHAGIDFCHSLIFGGPGESSETVRETVRLMDEIRPKAVIAMTGIRIYPGTEIARRAVDEGLIAPRESLLGPRFYFAGKERGLLRLISSLAAERRNWFLPGGRDWSAAIGPRLLRLVHRAGPLWTALRPSKVPRPEATA